MFNSIIMCSIFGEMINTLRSIPSNVKMWIYIGAILLCFIFLIKGIKVNYNQKNEKKRNIAWFFPLLLLMAFIIIMSI